MYKFGMNKFALLFLTVTLAAAMTLEYKRLTIKPWPPAYFTNDEDHFKYGSIGAEVNGYPYLIWRELPSIFRDRLPKGFQQFGFLSEPGKTLPVGVSVRRYGVKRVGFNCATCHTSTYRIDGEEHFVYGAPSNALDLQSYIQFLVEISRDKRLTADAVIESAEDNGRPIGFFNRMILRWVVFPRLENEVAGLTASLAWMDGRAAHGPGRTDAGNFWRARWNLKPEDDNQVGTVDFPSVWKQEVRLDGWFHWDGNNKSLDERNISAALAGGASEWLLERQSIKRVSDWLMELPPPAFPAKIDANLAEMGKSVYQTEGCGVCHDPGGAEIGQITPLKALGTDPARADLFSPQMVAYFSEVGRLYSWQFRNYRAAEGYANAPLDGIWMRAPYLHNGSVPTLKDLLAPPQDRPAKFYRGCTEFDSESVGFVCDKGFLLDTAKTGNGNGGHLYGTALPEDRKAALLEYLKTR